jgi:hypothetical protein
MITEQEKVRGRDHLGYANFASQSTFSLGIPAALQTTFMVEGAFTKILPQAEPLFRKTLDRLDQIECQIEENTENVEASEVGEIKLRPDSFKQLIIRYRYWQGKLANMLGVLPNPYDFRPWLGSGYNGGGGVNVSVVH